MKLNDLVDKEGYIVLSEDLSCKAALSQWRKLARPAKFCDVIYVLGKDEKLVGTLDLKDLLLEESWKRLGQIMNKEFVFVHEKDHVSNAVSVVIENHIAEVPVLNKQGQLVGLVPTNRLLDALNWINTKNIYHLMGILKARERTELGPLLILRMAQDRIVWLAFAVLASIFIAGSIIKNYETVIITIPTITFFIPVLMGFGGNVGTQTSMIFVRFLAKKDPGIARRLLGVLAVELSTGLLLGVILGGITAASAILFFTDFRLGLVLFISMVTISVLAVILGFLIPYASNRLRLDPAVVSGPVVTSIKDITALLVYFLIVQALL